MTPLGVETVLALVTTLSLPVIPFSRGEEGRELTLLSLLPFVCGGCWPDLKSSVLSWPDLVRLIFIFRLLSLSALLSLGAPP